MAPSKALIISSFSFIFGVAIASFSYFSWNISFIVFIVIISVLIIVSQRDKKVLLAILLVLGFFIFGFIRAQFFVNNKENDFLILNDLRSSLIEKANRVISGEESAIFFAMVLGHKDDLSLEVKEAFNRTGTRHILAISGLHLTIVAAIILEVLLSAGLSRIQSFWLAILGILFFILLVGLPPSAVRAGIMASLYLLARTSGRIASAWRLLVFAAVIMLIINPQLLLFSVGFQLSFLAVLGIILFKPFFDKLIGFLRPEGLRNLMSLSLAAQITTWPIIAYNFGSVSIISPLANLVAVPLLPVIMILGLSFLVFGWSTLIVAKIILWPVWIIIHFLLSFISYLSAFNYVSFKLSSLSLFIIISYYFLLAGFYIIIKNKDIKNA